MKTKWLKPKYFISPDDAYRTWESSHADDLAVLTPPIHNTKDLFIHYRFFPSTERAFDLSNKIESINDMMVRSWIIEDDNWKVLGHYMPEVIEKRKDEEVEVIFYRKK